MTRPLAAVLSLLLALAAVLLGAGPASAHAALVSTDPADGATLAQAPSQVGFTFSEEIQQPAYVVVTAAGKRVEQGDARVDGATVTADVAADAPAGRWTMAYRVVSVDGHPVTGEVSFTVDAPATTDKSADPSATASPDPSPTPSPGATATTTAAAGQGDDDGLWPLHAEHVVLGVVLLALAGGLLVVARRRARRS